MRIHHRTRADRKALAMKSEEVLDQDPNVTMQSLAIRLGLSYSNMYRIRKEFGCRPLCEIPGREK